MKDTKIISIIIYFYYNQSMLFQWYETNLKLKRKEQLLHFYRSLGFKYKIYIKSGASISL